MAKYAQKSKLIAKLKNSVKLAQIVEEEKECEQMTLDEFMESEKPRPDKRNFLERIQDDLP